LYLSGTYGTIPDEQDDDVLPYVGKLGADLSIEDGYQSARLMAQNHLAMAKAVLGDLDRVVRVLQLLGFVNAAPGFRDSPRVLNGASDLLLDIFGKDPGSHARSALYQHELARDAPVAAHSRWRSGDSGDGLAAAVDGSGVVDCTSARAGTGPAVGGVAVSG
jgi:enamine deaminase RidA (YjgF/YER057c/UK114 family)